ncbi:MAG TPA: beta-propeller domain-containing protein [Pyrinomonadaceae bacterium]|nr:beta-propeller domain-containing protein [Pyrinomonadaceae bacterium]
MKPFLILTLAIITAGLLACATGPTDTIPPVSAATVLPTKKTMRAFGSEQELARYLRQLAEKQKRVRRDEQSVAAPGVAVADGPVAAPQPLAKAANKDGAADESVTNTQHAGVDEGGIVKIHGDHLVVLRRGRLFTVAIGDGALTPISHVDAFAPDLNPNGTWYDEMLVSGDTVVVIGYSYERGGTEVGLFNITDSGQLSYRSTYHLRSNDYYSSRNYASRLIGNKLIFYAPLYLYPGAEDPFSSFPAVRKWHKNAKPEEFQRIVSATRVYRPETQIDVDYGAALHTVTVCDLANGGFACQATSVLGPAGRVFYVSPDAVYVWASSWYGRAKDRSPSTVFRMPLDGSGPSALRVSGSPVDQFSFLQSDDQHLNVLVRSESAGDGMWAAEVAEGDVALMRVPVMSFSDGSEAVPASSYRRLPKPEGYTFQNRFVQDYLIYGTGSGWGYPEQKKDDKSNLFIVNWSQGNSHHLTLPHGVDRIEQMGPDAVIVGTDGKDLHFSSLRLGQWPEIVSRYTRKAASQGELRSHGFFYKPDGDNTGTLGLPISVPGRPGYQHLFESSAAILFLRNDSLQFREVGELGAQAEKAVNDQCRASCVDWYGNARPLFLRGRLFALLGYEIVEGTIDDGRMKELRRISYAPGQAKPRTITD